MHRKITKKSEAEKKRVESASESELWAERGRIGRRFVSLGRNRKSLASIVEGLAKQGNGAALALLEGLDESHLHAGRGFVFLVSLKDKRERKAKRTGEFSM